MGWVVLFLLVAWLLIPPGRSLAFSNPKFCTQRSQNDQLQRCQWFMNNDSYTVFATAGRSLHVASREQANLELQKAENSGFCQRVQCNQVQNCTTEFVGGNHVIYAQFPRAQGWVALQVAHVATPS